MSQFPTSIFSLDSCCPTKFILPQKLSLLLPVLLRFKENTRPSPSSPPSILQSCIFQKLFHRVRATRNSITTERQAAPRCGALGPKWLGALCPQIHHTLSPSLARVTLRNTTLPGAACAGLHIQVLVCATASLRMPSPPLCASSSLIHPSPLNSGTFPRRLLETITVGKEPHHTSHHQPPRGYDLHERAHIPAQWFLPLELAQVLAQSKCSGVLVGWR